MYYSQEEWSLPPLDLDEADHEGDGGEARSSVSSSLEEEAHSRSLPYSRRKVRYLKRQPSWRQQAAEDGRNFAARPSREAFLQARHDFEAKRRDSLLDSEEQESGASSSSSSSSRKEGEEGIWLKGGRTVEEEEEGDGEDECWWHWTRAAALSPAKPIWLDISMPENAGREAPNLSSTSTTTRPPRAAPRRHPSTTTSPSSSSSSSLSASPKNTGTPAKEGREPTPLQPPSDADAETDDANERRHAAFLRASYAAQYRASRLPPPAPVDPGGPDGRPDAAHDWHREDFSHWWRNDGSDSDSDPGTVVRLPAGRGRRLER